MRNPGHILFTLNRAVRTNQRIYFDMSTDKKWLFSGSTDGNLIAWALNDDQSADSTAYSSTFKCHDDCLNGVR